MSINLSQVYQVDKPLLIQSNKPLDAKFVINSDINLTDIAPTYVGHIFFNRVYQKHYKVTSLKAGYLDYSTNQMQPFQPSGTQGVDYDVIPNYYIDTYEEFGAGGSTETPQTIKTKYESNADTNAYTDAEKTKLAGIEAGAQVNPTFKTVGGQSITGAGDIPVNVAFNLQSDSIATYANLPTGLNNTTDVNKAYYVQSDKLVYVWDGTAFPVDGAGLEISSLSDYADSVLDTYVTDYENTLLFEFGTGGGNIFGVQEEKGLLSTENQYTPYSEAGWDFRLFRNIPINSPYGKITQVELNIVRPGGFPNNASFIGVKPDGSVDVLVTSLVSTTGNIETFTFNDLTPYDYISFAQYVTNQYPQSLNTDITISFNKEDAVKRDVEGRVASTHIDLIDWGCVGDGITDDTDKINAAIKHVIDSGGGTIFGRDRKFKVTSLTVPAIRKWGMLSIEGTKMPAPRIGTIDSFNVTGNNGFELISDLNDNTKGVINVDSSPYGYLNFNLVLLSIKNCSIRTYQNPNCHGINAVWAGQINLENVHIDTGVYNVQAIEPTNQTVGVKLPGINNAAFNYLRYVSVAGFHHGIDVEEHTDGDQILLHSCKHALWFNQANHASYFKRVLGQRNTNQLSVGGSHVFQVAQLNMEFTGSGQTTPDTAWQATQYEVNDPSNLGVGNITYANVQGNVGKVSTCRINGAANILIQKVGSTTYLTAPGIS